ncbi:MAG: alpha-galactosidase [Clostridia bacterium]|nr:alpha-galactosidase [Clostridia bacterium]
MLLDFSQNGLYMVFEVDEAGFVSLRHFSSNEKESLRQTPKNLRYCRIVNIHCTGENPDDHHGAKHSGASRDNSLKYVTHRYYENKNGNKLEFDLADSTMAVTVHYQFYKNTAAVRSWSVVKNIGNEDIDLEYVSSFAYTGLEDGIANPHESVNVYIPHNSWCRECDWKKRTLSDCGIDFSTRHAFNRVNIYNTGFWSTKEYLPMGAVENTERECLYLWQIESCGSWQWEIADASNLIYFKLSGPCAQENSWFKTLSPGESFESIKACVTLGKDMNSAIAEMTKYRRAIFNNIPENASMPVIFNNGFTAPRLQPTEENLLPLIDAVADLGMEYFMMDAGWYADGTWWPTVGEWQPVPWRFPNGIKKVFDYIREKGMVGGIWIEFECVGINCPLAKTMPDECFITRRGKRVIDNGRYILDFRNEQARVHCTEVVRRVVEDYGVGYIKNDYNVECGVGTDFCADSFGDGLLEHNRAFLAWYEEMRARFPHVIFENCASGGMRMDYAMLENQHIQSLTDQERYDIISRVAAAAETAVLPEQAAIWSIPDNSIGTNGVAMSMVNTMMQRMHLSGDVFPWSEKTKELVKEGIAVYKATRADISTAIPFYPLGEIPAFTDGWLCTGYKCKDCVRYIIWRLEDDCDTLTLPTDFEFEAIKILYPSNNKCIIDKLNGTISITLPEKMTAVFIELN